MVFCTSGNELILECVYNKIPVATIPCSTKQMEQIQNYKQYVKILKYAISMDDSIDLDLFVNRNVNNAHHDLNATLKDRDEKILKLVNI